LSEEFITEFKGKVDWRELYLKLRRDIEFDGYSDEIELI